ncbi:MAG: sodium/solute symporter [Candidatus Hydrogenedentes bacterium]|nr:sodium/solute symporter [Candidatus Hydrogenedentota bacterium]
MSNFTMWDYGILILYFASMAALGPLFAHKGKTTEGYFLGDRSFPGWLIGFSMFATSISSVTFMAYPADAFKTAWYRMTPNVMLPIAVFIAALFFLPFFRRTRIVSAYEFLEVRFGPKTRLYAAVAFIISQVIRVSLILFLVSVLFHEMTGLNVYYCILIGGLVTSFYTVLGGIQAVMWTDFIQSVVLWIGGLGTLYVALRAIPGGVGQVISMASEAGKFSMMDLNAEGVLETIQFSPDFTKKTISLFLLVGLGNWLAEYSSNQNVIQKYASARDAKQARVAIWVCCLFSVPTWALFMFIGTTLWVFFQLLPTPEASAMLTGAAGAKAEQILPYFIINYLPAGVSGLVIAAVLAAAMSSLSGSINATSAVSLVDVYKRHIAPDKTDRHYVLLAKGVGFAMSVLMLVGAALLQYLQSSTLQDSATILTALTAGGLLGIYLLGFFTKRGDDRSILLGIAFTLIFSLWMVLSQLGWLPDILISPIHSYYAGMLGHILMFVIGYIFGIYFHKVTEFDQWEKNNPDLN